MAFTVTFAALSNATGANLDANFNQVGKIGAIPCSVSGSNAVTLTPIAGQTPTISAYATGLQFAGIVATTNTTATTLRVNALAALNCYKDTVTGPAALSGGELISGNAFTAVYDAALNSGAGGWHIYTSTAFAGGTITGNVVLSPGSLSVFGSVASLGGATLTSMLLTGNSLSVVAPYGSFTNASIASLSGSVSSLTGANTAPHFVAQGASVAASLTSVLLSGPSLTITGVAASLAGPATVTSLTASLSSVTKLMVGASASSLTRLITGLATVAYTVTNANDVQDQTFALAGAEVNDSVALGLPASIPAGAGFTGFMSAAGTVTLRIVNPTTVTLGAATITVRATAQGFT